MQRAALHLFALFALTLSGQALAQEDTPAPLPQETTSKENTSKDEKEKWCKEKWEGPDPWGCVRSISPSIGMSALGNVLDDTNELLFKAGGSVSIFNWKREGLISTKVLLYGTYFLQGDGRGYDVGLAGYLGLRKTHWAAAIGAEFWRNYWEVAAIHLPATNGLSIPIFLELGPEFIHLVGGFAPGFVSNPVRRVDWDVDYQAPGFAHELSFYVGTEMTIRLFSIALAFERERLANGVSSWGFTLGVGF